MTTANAREYCPCVIKYAKNSKMLELNVEIVQELPGEDQAYASVDSAVCDSEEKATHYPHELFHVQL